MPLIAKRLQGALTPPRQPIPSIEPLSTSQTFFSSTFLILLEKIAQSSLHSAMFANVANERTILQKVNRFKNILDQQGAITDN
jgi:hypothetical protein